MYILIHCKVIKGGSSNRAPFAMMTEPQTLVCNFTVALFLPASPSLSHGKPDLFICRYKKVRTSLND